MRIKSIISAMVAVLCLAGCSQKPEEQPSRFEVNPSSLTVDAGGGQVSFMILSTAEDWMARSDKDWVKILTVTAKPSADPVTVKVVASENISTEQRQATITVTTMSGAKSTVTLTQSAGTGGSVGKGITSAEDLLAFAKAFNSGTGISTYKVDGEIKLMNDIDASSIREWIPIGTKDMPFGETFNGNGHAINNISWEVDTDKYPDAGLIGYAKNSKVYNLVFGSKGSSVRFTGKAACVGGLVGNAVSCTISKVENKAALSFSPASSEACFGGICGLADASTTIGDATLKSKGCINSGTLLCTAPCLEGGIAGSSAGVITNCTNNGAVLGKYSPAKDAGPTWGCAHISKTDGFVTNFGNGFVGDYDSFKDSPSSARPAVHSTATLSSSTYYDIEKNTVDWTLDTYYDWDVLEQKQLHPGVKYFHCSFTGMNRHMHVLEIDLSNPEVELTTAYADECVPNPNGNKNGNNGKNIRELLSELCNRRRSEGQKIIAGVNSGFFDSNDGISRGFHVEEGEPVYINNPDVSGSLGNHAWGITVFTDKTASCGKKALTATLEAAENSFRICSVNDTILRHVSPKYEVNMYTGRYKEYPHPEKPTLVNALAANAFYIVARYTSDPVKVNAGWAEAKVISTHDGTSAKLTSLPYITEANQVGFAVSGSSASTLKSLKAGDVIRLKVDIAIDGVTKPIFTQNSSMYKLMTDGKDETNSPGSTASLYSTFDPMTFPVVSQDGRTVWLIEVDGRQPDYSIGVKGYEMYRIAKKLGGSEMTRLDGGGSSCMWIFDESKKSGSIVNRVSDSKGERSCLNYLLVRLK